MSSSANTISPLMDGASPLRDALALLRFPNSILTSIAGVDWMSFGKMDSHIYRKKLMDKFRAANLSGEEMFMVYFVMSAVKNQKRVLMGLDSLPDNIKSQTWWINVRAFVDGHLCQYVSQANKTKKFPAVNIPVTNPGMDILCWAIWVPIPLMTTTELFNRPNASQLALNASAQSQAKLGYANYWDNIIKGTQNPDAKDLNLPKPQMREEYYKNAEGDSYPLIGINLKPIAIPADGYSIQDLNRFMYTVKLTLQLARIAFKKDKTYQVVPYSYAPENIANFSHWVDTYDGLLNELRANKAAGGSKAESSKKSDAPVVTPAPKTATTKPAGERGRSQTRADITTTSGSSRAMTPGSSSKSKERARSKTPKGRSASKSAAADKGKKSTGFLGLGGAKQQ